MCSWGIYPVDVCHNSPHSPHTVPRNVWVDRPGSAQKCIVAIPITKVLFEHQVGQKHRPPSNYHDSNRSQEASPGAPNFSVRSTLLLDASVATAWAETPAGVDVPERPVLVLKSLAKPMVLW